MSPDLPDAPAIEPATEQQLTGSAPTLEAFRLTVIEGPDEGKSFFVDPRAPQRVFVGTSPACEIRLHDRTISRRHAALDLVGARCRITDLGSTNGTLVDGVAIVEGFLRGREVVRFGSTALQAAAEPVAAGAARSSAVGFGKMLGASEAMRRLYPLLERLSATRMAVLIEGETGTGKELLAESLHEVSGAAGAFIVFDCAAVAPDAAEAELFGHAGSDDRPGAFEQAHQGTLFLDEIGDLDLALQAKLLRAIERGEIWRAGAKQAVRVQVRVVAATQRDLEREVAERCFHEELLRRLSLARIELPPLRARRGDVPLLARRFSAELGAPPDLLSAEALTRFERHAWPGNVRELQSAVARRFLLGEAPLDDGEDDASAPRAAGGGRDDASLDHMVARMIDASMPFPVARRQVVDAFVRRYVERILEVNHGSVAKAVAASGLGRRYFQLVKARSHAG